MYVFVITSVDLTFDINEACLTYVRNAIEGAATAAIEARSQELLQELEAEQAAAKQATQDGVAAAGLKAAGKGAKGKKAKDRVQLAKQKEAAAMKQKAEEEAKRKQQEVRCLAGLTRAMYSCLLCRSFTLSVMAVRRHWHGENRKVFEVGLGAVKAIAKIMCCSDSDMHSAPGFCILALV
jgi:hypothetical protein